LTNGEPEAYIDEERAAVILKEEDLEVEIDLGSGEEEARVWTCDFSHVSLAVWGTAMSADLIGIRYYQWKCKWTAKELAGVVLMGSTERNLDIMKLSISFVDF